MIYRQISKIVLQILPGSDLRYLLLHKSPDRLAPRLVTPNCELVIDGFPRSANTWIYYHVQVAFPETRIAHHVHSWQQFLLARFYRVPSILIVRNPDACVQSLATKRGGVLMLHYLDYLMTTGFGALFANKVYLFDKVTGEHGIDDLIRNVAEIIGKPASAPDPAQVKALMEERTENKNVKTPPFQKEVLGPVSKVSRRIAKCLYKRLKGRLSS
ncbi:MAG: hypothetical protein RIA08_16080 [Roseovarius sp.]|uniref:hypothetical protein n=1 Tax=Roseovarius sp. TaxID=1486281 RepID=UPI0032EEF5E0